MSKAGIISFCGKVPVLGTSLRKIGRRYPEGSVVTIGAGHLAGYKWKRSHRYVSGYWLGHYELPIQECLVRELKPGGVFYDVGANAGFFSLLGAKTVGEAGSVFAFEPLPENIRTIRDQFEVNNLTGCSVVDRAVSNRCGKGSLTAGSNTSTAKLGRRTHEPVGVHEVSTVTLNEFSKTHPHPDFIKIDVEGAEIFVLEGASDLLACRLRPKLLIEFHSRDLTREGFRILQTHSYRMLDLRRRELEGCSVSSRHVLALPDTAQQFRLH